MLNSAVITTSTDETLTREHGFQSHTPFSALADHLLAHLPDHGITLLPLADVVTVDDIRRVHPYGPVFAADFYLQGAEDGEHLPYGFRLGDITNVDHHAPVRRMERTISSGNLAARYVRAHGPVPPEVPVVLHHADCDSVVAAFILRGLLPAEAYFEDAVIAADHTGQRHPVADLLQALDKSRDLVFSGRNLARVLKNAPLEPEAARLLQRREDERAEALRIKSEGRYRKIGSLIFIEADGQLSGEFFPALFPEAALILITKPAPQDRPGVWHNKLRLGSGAPEGFTLNDLDMREFDSNFGGRWNAGADNRGGGTPLPPEEYANGLAERLMRALGEFRAPENGKA